MKTSSAGRKALIAREGSRTQAYQDSIGVWTIGVGHTAAAGSPKPVKGMVITAAQVDEILTRDLVQYERAVTDSCGPNLTQGQFDACVSLCFNIGPSAFRKSSVARLAKSGDIAGAADAFMSWNKAGGKVLAGLTKRRRQERAQFLGGSGQASPLGDPDAVEAIKQGAKPPLPAPAVSSAEVTAIQNRLTQLGYRMVGKVDGIEGARTAAAYTAFQRANGLTVNGRLDDATKAALWSDDAKPMPVDDERATATAKDLLPDSKIIQTALPAEKVSVAGMTITGAGAGLNWLSDKMDTLTSLKALLSDVSPYVWLGLVFLVFIGAWLAFRAIKQARVTMHRTGETG